MSAPPLRKIPANEKTTPALPNLSNLPAPGKIPVAETVVPNAASSFLERGKTPTVEDEQWSYRYQLDQGLPQNQKPVLKPKKSNSFPNLTLNFNFGDDPNHRPLERVESSLSNDGRLMRELGSILQ